MADDTPSHDIITARIPIEVDTAALDALPDRAEQTVGRIERSFADMFARVFDAADERMGRLEERAERLARVGGESRESGGTSGGEGRNESAEIAKNALDMATRAVVVVEDIRSIVQGIQSQMPEPS